MTKQKWEQELRGFPEANFLQSWAWGEFHKNLGHSIYRKNFNCGMFLAIVEHAKQARYLIVPGGPLLMTYSLSQWKQALLLMKELALQEKCSFIRIRPQLSATKESTFAIERLGFRSAPMHLHAEITRVLDLTLSDELLLSQMRKSTRYEIRKAQRTGIDVKQSTDETLIDDFVRLQHETSVREGFVPFSKKYLLEQFRALHKDQSVRWFLVRSDHAGSQPISMAFVIFYRDEAVYHYAASSAQSRHLPVAYAIQWAIIQEAKKRGCVTYNLWGDVPDSKLGNHRFSGPSLFKRGFGGSQVAYLHAHDYSLSWKYWIDWGFETVRKNLRGL